MKREIKFRANVKYNGFHLFAGEWVVGSVITRSNSTTMFVVEEDNLGNVIREFETEVIHETVGQFTGLKDQDGKEIYEGDIVSYTNPFNHNEYTHKVLWDDTWACFGLFNNESKFAQETDWVKIIKVSLLGNIHDNPELL